MSNTTGPSIAADVAVGLTVTLNDYRSVAITIVPAAMQPAIMLVELSTRAAIVITVAIIMIPVAAPKPSAFVVALGENEWGTATFLKPRRKLFEWIFSKIALWS
jgi:hypothetical protein